MIKFFAVNLASWVLASWFRAACITSSLILLGQLVWLRVSRFLEFRRKIDQLPGPPTNSPILGNIPMKVLSLLMAAPSNTAAQNRTNTSTSATASNQTADDFYLSQIQSLLGHTIIYKDEPLFRLWLGQEPVVCVWKAEVVEQVLSDNFLLEKSYHYDFLRPWLGDGLLTSPGRIWRPRRKLLVPSFHFNILRAFVPVFDRKSTLMVRNINQLLLQRLSAANSNFPSGNSTTQQQKIEQQAANTIVLDITPVITACTLDAICETIMGVSIDAQTSESSQDYCQSIYIVGETFLERIIQPRYWLDTLFRYTQLGKLYSYHLNKLHSFTRQVIAEKKRQRLASSSSWSSCQTKLQQAGPSKLGANLKVLDRSSVDQFEASMSAKKGSDQHPKLPKAFLDLLLERVLTNSPETQRLSDEEIREEVDTFMFEGHDTTAMALSWTLFLLGHNQSAQQRLQEEVDRLFDSFPELEKPMDQLDGLNLDHLKQLKYLDCVIKEALRLCPSVPFIGRKTTSELQLAGYSIPAGSVVFVLIYQLHRDSRTFPNPEKFDPDRFLPENIIGRHPFAYVPFSAGPRNCIGQKFAMAEMKTILLHLMRNFNFESVTSLDKARVQMEMVLRPKCPLNIRITAREKTK